MANEGGARHSPPPTAAELRPPCSGSIRRTERAAVKAAAAPSTRRPASHSESRTRPCSCASRPGGKQSDPPGFEGKANGVRKTSGLASREVRDGQALGGLGTAFRVPGSSSTLRWRSGENSSRRAPKAIRGIVPSNSEAVGIGPFQVVRGDAFASLEFTPPSQPHKTRRLAHRIPAVRSAPAPLGGTLHRWAPVCPDRIVDGLEQHADPKPILPPLWCSDTR